MCDVFGVRADHFRAEETAGALLAVDVQNAFVAQHHLRAALILKRDVAHFKAAAGAELLAQLAEG